MYLTDLAAACRKSGLRVVEVDGWRTRGHGPFMSVSAVVCHHTAAPESAYDDENYPSLGIVRDGRGGAYPLPGPLANLGLGRDGTVYVIAAGYAYHAGEVRSSTYSNARTIGIEAEHNGVSPWPDALVDAYARLCAALIEHYSLPVFRVLGHKEVCYPAGRKIDPNFDMPEFRKHVTYIAKGDDMDYSEWPEKVQRQMANDVAEAVVTKLKRTDLYAKDPDKDVSVAEVLRDVDRENGK